MRASSTQKLQLDLLRRLGLPENQVSEIREHLHRRDDLSVNMAGQVAFGTLQEAAGAVEAHLKKTGERFVPFPTDAIAALIAKVPGDALKVPRGGDFPAPQVQGGEPVEHAPSLDARVKPESLGSVADRVKGFLERHAPELGEAFGRGEATVGQLGAALGTGQARRSLGADLERALDALGKVGGPGHTARDVTVNLDSRFSHLDGSTKPGEVGVFQKRMVEHLTAKRNQGGGFTVHGFENDAVVVSVPKGATVLLLNDAGDQSGARLRPEATKIGDATHQAVTISRDMVQPRDRKMFAQGPEFGVRVIDRQGEVLYQRNLAFDPKTARTSKPIFSGQLEAHPGPSDELAELWDHYRPDPRANGAGVGERPRFTVDGESGDRVRIQRDGRSFDLSRWVQFLRPPKAVTQTFQGDRGFVHLDYRNTSRDELDAKDYDPAASGRLKTSYGRGISLDPSMHSMMQARWGARGIRVFAEGMRSVLAAFDPRTDGR